MSERVLTNLADGDPHLLRATLYSIGDAVISTDTTGRVARMNPVAEQLTGWREEEAAGRPLQDIFRIIDEQTRRPAENPVERVLREGAVAGLANHTLLISKEGKEIPIAASGAPVLDHQGNITGVVLVFRDQTEERLAQRFVETRLSLIEYAASHTLDELLTHALDKVGTFVDSPIGFYHFVELDQKTLSLQQWSTRTLKEFCRAEGQGMRYDLDQAGVWVECVHQQKPVIHNDYAALPHKKGLPDGHAEVIRELVVPVMRDGKVVSILGVGNKPADYTEKDVAVVSYLADVTWEIVRQKRADEALQESEARYRTLFEHASDAIFLYDENDKIIDANQQACEMLGYTGDELRQMTVADLQAPEVRGQEGSIIKREMEQYAGGLFETLDIHRDGTLIPVEVSNAYLSGRQSGLVLSIARDITERKRTEKTLQESEEHYRRVIESSGDMVFSVDRHGYFRTAGGARLTQFGLRPEDVVGRSLEDLFPTEEAAHYREHHQRVFESGKAITYEQILNFAGVKSTDLTTVYPIMDEARKVESVGVICRDITEHKQAEEALRWQNTYLTALHETTVELLAQLDLETVLENIVRRASQLLATSSGYLDLVEPETGQLRPRVRMGALAESLTHPTRSGEGLAGTVWQTRQPLVVNDYDNWPGRIGDFTSGILSAVIGVPLLSGDRLLGVLGLGHEFDTQRTFEPKDVEILTQFARLATIAIENARLFAAAQKELAERKRAEGALKETGQFLQNVFDAIRDGISVLDTDLNVVRTNRRMEQMYPHRMPLEGHKCYQVYQQRQSACPWCPTLQTIGTGQTHTEIVPYPSADNPTGWIELSAFPIKDEQGRVTNVIEYVKDITERRRAEDALRESEIRYRLLAENATDVIWTMDMKLRSTYTSPSVKRLRGYEPEELMAHSLEETLTPDSLQTALEVLEEELAIEQIPERDLFRSRTLELEFKRRDGSTVCAETTVTFLRDADGQAIGILGVSRDISDRKRAEAALRESEEDYRQLFEAESDAIFLIDNQTGRLLQANQAASEMYNYSRDVLLTMKNSDLSAEPEQTQQVTQTSPPAPNQVITIPLRWHRKKDGTRFPVEITGRFFIRAGRPVHIAAIRDITERKQAEDALRTGQAALQKAQRVAHVGSWTWHIQSNQLEWSDEMYRIFGIDEASFSGDLADVIARAIHPDDREAVERSNLSVIQNKTPVPLEYRIVLPDGTTRTVWAEAGELILDDAGNPAILSGIVQDITERKRAEEALRSSEERHRLHFEHVSDVIYSVDHEFRLLDITPSVERVLGYKPEELIDRLFLELHLLAPEYLEQASSDAMRVLGGERIPSTVYQFIARDGTRKWGEVSSAPLVCDGQAVALISVARDITERVQVEEALRESEERYRTFFHNSPLGIFRSTFEGQYVEVNPALAGLLGYDSPETVIREVQNIGEQIYVQARDRERIVSNQLESANVAQHLNHYRRRDGSEFIANLYLTTVRDSDGRPLFLEGIVEDITERKRADEERERLLAQIHGQARQMVQILDTVPAGVLLLDAKGRILQANPMAEKGLVVLEGVKVGDTLTHLGDRPLAELLTSPPKGLWHQVKAGKRTFEVIARPVESGPQPEQWVLVVNDVTQEREIREQLQQQERLATVGQMAAGIAHDFNNIMATIILYARMLERADGLSGRDRERLAIVNQQAWHAARLIEQILDFSRRAVLERRPLDLTPLLKEQVKLLERTLPEHIELDLVCGPDEYTVDADPTRMQQMLTNLAVNARDAMPDGGALHVALERITVEPRTTPPLPEMKPGQWIRLTVSDSGTGIPPDVLPHIFEPFFTTKEPGAGSGLGLAQVHGIVGQHGGHIGVETQVGVGTTFTIFLPALAVRPAEPPAANLFTVPKGRGELVLVVEDEKALLTALTEILQELNYRALEAANGQEALALMEEQGDKIALILSDVVMPGMGGMALFHALREKGWQTPVILLTGHPLEKELEELRREGLAAWLAKPPSLDRLAQAMDDALRQ